jgi:hypothetical protein
MKYIHVAIAFLLTTAFTLTRLEASAQAFQRFDYLRVTENGSLLRYPWTGGLNNVLFGKADINHDGKRDLVVYDKSNNKFCVFLTQGNNSINYKFDARYGTNFPPVSGWMILKDYNCDGIEDFFTYNGVANTKVYTGYYDNDTLKFRLQQDGFYYQRPAGFFNVYVSDVIKPAIIDVNKDGDLDVISFNVFGNRLEYYENQQKELALSCDSLFFTKTDNCWGNVRDTLASAYALRDTCDFKFGRLANQSQAQHTGSYIESADVDHNGAVDVVIGSTTLNNLTMLYNKGVPSYASILTQDVNYPNYSIPFNCTSFGAPHFLDADNDGKTDLLVSTFDVGSSNVNNIWYYKNLTTDSIRLQFQQKNFLLDNMIDAGENSNPCFMDVDGDGLKDILLGSGGYKDNGSNVYKLRFYKNTGTSSYPEFTLHDDDFLGISGLNVRDIAPAAGDLDNDNDSDLVIGISDGRLLYWENTAFSGAAPNLLYRGILKDSSGNSISVGINATPCLVDLNRDGKTDLVIGELNGNLNYYRGSSIGSASLYYVTDSLGKVRIKNAVNNNGYTQAVIRDINGDNKYDMILGTNLLGLQFYNDIEDHLNDSFTTHSLIVQNLGYRTTSCVDDITGDGKLELLTGNIDGGLIIFSEDPPPFQPTGIAENFMDNLSFDVFPNPANQHIYIHLEETHHDRLVQLFNLLGKEIFSKHCSQQEAEIDTHFLNSGLYLLKVSSGDKEGIQKIVIQH